MAPPITASCAENARLFAWHEPCERAPPEANMRTSPIIALSLALSFGGCALPAEDGGVMTLENATGKADGRAVLEVPLSSDVPGATVRLTCDENPFDQCEIYLQVYVDLATEWTTRDYLGSLGFASHVDLAAIRVVQPDGERAVIHLNGHPSARPEERDVIRMTSRSYYDDEPYTIGHLEASWEVPGQYVIRSWQKGEYLIELDHLPLPDAMPDARTIYIRAFWE
jgi:hypothetical protein